MRLLFIENEDSFSWNVLDALPVPRAEVMVRPGREAAADPAVLAEVDALLIGPGPTDPARAGLLPLVRAAAARGLPLLGICLGCQAIGMAFGARLVRTPPAHGQPATAAFGPSRFFGPFRGPHAVMRYHSLSLAAVAPPLRVVAATPEGIPMAVEHERLPIAGLQFHPDSYATPRGAEMIAAFFQAAR